MRIRHAVPAAMGLSLLLGLSGGAFAATSSYDANTSNGPAAGTTSGPAAGTNVYTGNKKMAHNGKKMNAVGGAPGVQGQKGSKNGPAATPQSR